MQVCCLGGVATSTPGRNLEGVVMSDQFEFPDELKKALIQIVEELGFTSFIDARLVVNSHQSKDSGLVSVAAKLVAFLSDEGSSNPYEPLVITLEVSNPLVAVEDAADILANAGFSVTVTAVPSFETQSEQRLSIRGCEWMELAFLSA